MIREVAPFHKVSKEAAHSMILRATGDKNAADEHARKMMVEESIQKASRGS